MELQRRLPEIESRGASLVAVTAAPVGALRTYAQELGLTFPLLADPEREVIRAWGVEDPANRTAWPAIFLVSTQGTIVWRSLATTYKIEGRPSPDVILEELDRK